MANKRPRRSAEFTFCGALAARKEHTTLSQRAREFAVHPTQIIQWKQHLLETGSAMLGLQRARDLSAQTEREAERVAQIGRLHMELEWLEKKLSVSLERKRILVAPDHPKLRVRRPCALLGLHRASSNQHILINARTLAVMRRIDEQYLQTPCSGWPRMTAARRRQGYAVTGTRGRRLMQQLGMQAVRGRTHPRRPAHLVIASLPCCCAVWR